MPAVLRWLAVSIVAAPLLLADEVLPSDGFADLRLGYCFAKKQADATVNGVDVPVDVQRADRASGGVVMSPGLGPVGGWLFGVKAVATFSRGLIAGQPASHDSIVAQFSVGYGYAFCRSFQLELMPYLGLGAGELQQTIAGAGTFEDTALVIQYGIDLNAVATITHGLQVGASVGYQIAASDHEFDNVPSLGVVKSKIRQRGAIGSLFIGGRF